VHRSAPIHHAGNPFAGLSISSITIDPVHPEIIFVAASDRGANSPVYGQGTFRNPMAGIWRYCPLADANGYVSDWYDLTNAVSDQRFGLVVLGGDSSPKNPDGTVRFPGVPGPDDWWYHFDTAGNIDWTLTFPATGVYSDVAITDLRTIGGNFDGIFSP